jgi:hypothetical protein
MQSFAAMKTLISCTLFFLLGCESGTSRSVKLTMPGEVPARFTASAPGLVVADLGGSPAAYVALCGQTPKSPLSLSQDLGFGCLGSNAGKEETVHVWVQPVPPGWTPAVLCSGSQADRSFYPALAPQLPDGGIADAGAFPGAADPTWPQGTAVASWRRDFSPCGGVINFEVTLAVP